MLDADQICDCAVRGGLRRSAGGARYEVGSWEGLRPLALALQPLLLALARTIFWFLSRIFLCLSQPLLARSN